MTVVGLGTTMGLYLLGLSQALALGMIAFFLAFVPYIGPIVAVIPALLVALTVGPMEAVYVGLLYVGVQGVESYLLTPLVQQRAVELPPGLTIAVQVVLGVLLGTLGIVFATPLTAVALVLVKHLYVEDILGDPICMPPASADREGQRASDQRSVR